MKKYIISLFLATLIVYNLNFSAFYNISYTDTAPARMLPFTILSGDGIYFDNYLKFFSTHSDPSAFLTVSHGHAISIFPISAGIFSIPVYLPFFVALSISGHGSQESLYEWSFALEKLSASFFASISVVLFFLLMKQLSVSNKISLFFSLLFAFSTQTFSTSSQHLWQQDFANLFLITSLLFFLKGSDAHKRGKFYFLSLIFAVLSFYSRITFIFVPLVFLLTIAKLDRRNTWVYSLLTLSGISLLLLYNLYFFNSLVGGYGTYTKYFSLSADNNIFLNLLGVLFSPGRGALMYTPLSIIALLSIVFYKKFMSLPLIMRRIWQINYLLLVFTVLINSFYGIWWGGNTWGDRNLAYIAVSTILICFFLFKLFNRREWILFSLTVLSIYSFFLQVIGVFYYPRGFYDQYPISISEDKKRLWNLVDNPIIRNFLAGPEMAGMYRFSYFLSGKSRQYEKQYGIAERRCSMSLTHQGISLNGYKYADIYFRNDSNIEWLTAGKYPLNIRYFLANSSESFESQMTSTSLSPILRQGQATKVRIFIIPPSDEMDQVFIAPVQEGVSWWGENCSVTIKI